MKFRAKPRVRKKAASGQTQTLRLDMDTSRDSPLRRPQCVGRSDTRGGGGCPGGHPDCKIPDAFTLERGSCWLPLV